ncbi:restriction endonuclease subunit S [Exiguobacterium sp. s7]|uniref:restriction endonuclease subunit S n=1 Tax=Exiguobacterium sp. s7 TaxID=2751235 RepID=UPI001BEB4B27|nr:restriction endonuclease subunit S [Exiguobacterium sp. s7]
MTLNYKRIGDCIQLVDERNVDLSINTLLGLSITKEFIPSVANTIGTDLKNYKVIRKNQFACSTMQVRRDKKMPVALLKDIDEAIISAAYPVFEVIDTNLILPEYLMMWFSRGEFDREACFYAIGGVRGSIEWEDFCNMQLPVPSIDKQRKVVKEFKVLKDRIELNNSFIQKLDETAQTIYKQWFIDFEFPDKDGKPYKSNKGEMEFNEELEREYPKGWESVGLSKIISVKDGTHGSPNPTDFGYPLVTSTHLNNYYISLDETYNISEEDYIQINKRSKVEKYDILFSMIGTVGLISYILYDEINFAIKNVGLFKTSEKEEMAEYILFYLKSEYMKQYIASNPNGSTQNYVTLGFLREMLILLPPNPIIFKFKENVQKIIENIHLKTKENLLLKHMQNIVLSKLAAMED